MVRVFVYSRERLRARVSVWVSFLTAFLPSREPKSDSSHTVMIHDKNTCQCVLWVALACELSACANAVCMYVYVCVCVSWRGAGKHKCTCVSAWRQMWLIFHGSHTLHTMLLLAGCTGCFHCSLPERGINATHDWTYMGSINIQCTYTHGMRTLWKGTRYVGMKKKACCLFLKNQESKEKLEF